MLLNVLIWPDFVYSDTNYGNQSGVSKALSNKWMLELAKEAVVCSHLIVRRAPASRPASRAAP